MENIGDYKNQIEITKKACEAVKRIRTEQYAKFSKWFHLRPRAQDVMIVSTHPARAMRGIKIASTRIEDGIKIISGCIASDDTVDWDRIKIEFMKIFDLRKEREFAEVISKEEREFKYQAEMINGLGQNDKLKAILGVNDLFFVGSEIIFKRGRMGKRKRIDIVAHDGDGKVFFFELKDPGNAGDDPVTQVKEYLDIYGVKGKDKNEVFEEMMKVYPQNPIGAFNHYIGCAVYGYGDSLISSEPTQYPNIKKIIFEI